MTPEQHQQWANAWEEWAAVFAQFTREDRLGFLVTLREIRVLPEVER